MTPNPLQGPRVLVVDHRDSFTYNLVDYLARNGAQVAVCAYQDLAVHASTPDATQALSHPFDGVMLGPGPGHPTHYPLSIGLYKQLIEKGLPVLGVCLGHQLMAVAHGVEVVQASRPLHGHASEVIHTEKGLWAGQPNPVACMRYHSWVVNWNERQPLPPVLIPTAWTASHELMAFRHREFPIFGLQFHPESVGSPAGERLIQHWLTQCHTYRNRTAQAAQPHPEHSSV